jgi:hypothetical protein
VPEQMCLDGTRKIMTATEMDATDAERCHIMGYCKKYWRKPADVRLRNIAEIACHFLANVLLNMEYMNYSLSSSLPISGLSI